MTLEIVGVKVTEHHQICNEFDNFFIQLVRNSLKKLTHLICRVWLNFYEIKIHQLIHPVDVIVMSCRSKNYVNVYNSIYRL